MKRKRSSFSALRWVSMILIFLAVLLSIIELVSYSRIRATFPPGMLIAGVPVTGLQQEQAAERLTQAYSIPVELHYGDAVIQLKPSVVGFELDLEAMMAAADLQRINQPFWSAFWDYLWNSLPVPQEVPLRYKISEERLRSFLVDEVAARYDQPAVAPLPVPGTVNFNSGEPGQVLEIDRAVTLIEDAFKSPSARVVNLTFGRMDPPRPSMQNLQILLQQIIDVNGFDGLTEIYLLDLQNGQELNFAYDNGEQVTPGIAFTAASTMKIPIMVSVFRRISEPTPPEIGDMITLMIERSENGPADSLMQRVMDTNLGPLQVTDDLNAMGLENTFLAGYFYVGAPLLRRIETPANSRTDIDTDPDAYDQTTPSDLGMLLDDIYQCTDNGGGTLAAVFPGEVSQSECKSMVQYLISNEIAVLIKAGLPEGTQIAHKHGWILDGDGLLHTMGDAGIVYTPGGNYVLAVFLYHPVQLIFDPANVMVSDLSRAVYNYFNLNSQ